MKNRKPQKKGSEDTAVSLKALLVTRDENTAKSVADAIDASERMELAATCAEVSALRPYLENEQISIAIIDIDYAPSRAIEDLDIVVAMYPQTRFIVVSKSFDNNLLLKAMQAGARHFLVKKSIPDELGKVLGKLVPISAAKEGVLGSVIPIFSASGGCGATTIAINLANELRLATREAVLVIDLDSYYGTISSYLGIEANYGLADVLRHKKPIDKHLVRSSAYGFKEDFHILVSRSVSSKGGEDSQQCHSLAEALNACREAYRYTIVDCPRADDAAIDSLAAVTETAVVVFQLNVRDLKFARSVVSSLTATGFPPEKILPLANRFDIRNTAIGLEDGKKALGLDCLYWLRSEWRTAINSANLGQPLAEVSPRSGLRLDFQKLASQIGGYQINENGHNGISHVTDHIVSLARDAFRKLRGTANVQ